MEPPPTSPTVSPTQVKLLASEKVMVQVCSMLPMESITGTVALGGVVGAEPS